MSSACGKFILGGEHSVVHKGRALSFPLPELRLDVEESESFDGLRVNGALRPVSEFQKILELRQVLGARTRIRGIEIRSEIPIGGGLGSSAALCTALARLHRPGEPVEQIARVALQGERLFHGSPSGTDPFTIALERPILFRAQDQAWRPLRMERFLDAKLCFALVDSRVRHRTSEVIEAVASVRQATPLIWEDLMDALSTNAEAMAKALEESPMRDLGRIMNDSHFRLIQLGVSCEEIDGIVENMRAKGALGAKLTGAGRGGFVLGLFRRDVFESAGIEGALVPDLSRYA